MKVIRRSEIASTVLTGQEYADVQAAALRAGLPLSGYIRKLILAALDADALPLSEDTGCPPGCPMQAALTEGQGNAAEVNEGGE